MSVVLLGAGPMAIDYARVLKALGINYVCVGRGAASAQAFCEATGVNAITGGLDQVPAPKSKDAAAIVAVPIPRLATATRRLLTMGYRRILVEKPAGLDAQNIHALAAAAAGSSNEIYVAYNRRFYASVIAARNLIAEDGGVLSWHVDFSELESRLVIPQNSPETLANWFYANACHMIDLAFHLGGEPKALDGRVAGELPWHKPAAFAGQGQTQNDALFTWHAEWRGPGRWGLDVRTRRRRLSLQPLEELSEQSTQDFGLKPITLHDDLDKRFKPGLFRQTAAFLQDSPDRVSLLTLSDHAARLDAFEAIRCGTSYRYAGDAVAASS
jgi:predicted dehydrogenase